MKHAKKRYCQHFLHDPGTIERIVRVIAPAPGDRLVEVGPGRGAITAPLLSALGEMDVIEIDADVVPRLQHRCRGLGKLRVHTPVSGTVAKINTDLKDHPEVVNSDPYGKGWIAVIELSKPAEVDQLMTAAQYEAFLASQKH